MSSARFVRIGEGGGWTGRALVCVAVLILPAVTATAGPPTGEQIYRQKCARCHGPKGEGTTDHAPDPLVGDKPLAELTRVIAETMPEDAPEECVGDDAARVAAYIHDAFYSPLAQARNRPAQIEFSRLTVGQYQNAVADLIATFTTPGKWDDERGLRADYYNDRRFRRDKKVISRRDPAVRFDFGESSPEPEKIGSEEFAIRWRGAVVAPETGDYEFVVETPNGFQLWVNDTDRPLIDVLVKSGDVTEYRGTVRLLGGRAYPVRLEYFKSKKEPKAAVSLKWKRPHQAVEVISERFLVPGDFPTTLVIQTPFPPDDRSQGYERGTAISKEWDQATTYAAIEVAGYVVAHLRDFMGDKPDAPDRERRLREFCGRFAERAFRRPLNDDLRRLVVDRQFDDAPSLETAVKRSVLLTLKSPRFLYRELGYGRFDAYDTAAWLSFGLWDSLPDKALLEAAAAGRLETREQIAQQAERMLGDRRTRAKLREFFHQWLGMERFQDLSKDGTQFPGFDEPVVSDLRTSLDLFLDDVVWGESSDFRQLLLADGVYLNGRLAQFYGVDLPADAPFQRVSFEPEKRAGVLTHPYLMAGLAYYSTSSPIHRGVFLARSVLGRSLKPPPEAVSPLAPDLHPDLTTRERTHLQTSPAQCQSCHAMINPLGFALEGFDAVGRFRGEERGRPVDAAGSYLTRTGELARFTGAHELAAFLAESPETHEAFVEQLFNHMTQQTPRAFGADLVPRLRQEFAAQNFNIRHLLVESLAASAVAVDARASGGRQPPESGRPPD